MRVWLTMAPLMWPMGSIVSIKADETVTIDLSKGNSQNITLTDEQKENGVHYWLHALSTCIANCIQAIHLKMIDTCWTCWHAQVLAPFPLLRWISTPMPRWLVGSISARSLMKSLSLSHAGNQLGWHTRTMWGTRLIWLYWWPMYAYFLLSWTLIPCLHIPHVISTAFVLRYPEPSMY